MDTNKVIKFSLAITTTCLILLGLIACNSGATSQPPANAAQTGTPNVTRVSPNATPLQTSNVTQVNKKQDVIASGQLAFVNQRDLTFGVGGQVSQVNVSEMDRVTKGQELAKLDTTSLEEAVRTAQLGIVTAQLVQESSQMNEKQAEYSVNVTETNVIQAQNNAKSANIDLENATDSFRKITYPYTYSTFAFDVPNALGFIDDATNQVNNAVQGLQPGQTSDRYAQALSQLQQALDDLNKGGQALNRGQGTDVFQNGYLSTTDFWTLRAAQLAMDKAQVALDNAQNTISSTALSVDNARVTLKNAQIAVSTANNNMDIANNNLSIAKTNLANATITAPFDGIVANVSIKEGEVLSSGNYATSVAMSVIDPTQMELDVMVNQLDIPNVNVGQKVIITVDALPGKQFNGAVTSIFSLPDIISGVTSYEVKTVLNVPQNSALKAGMSATADIVAN